MQRLLPLQQSIFSRLENCAGSAIGPGTWISVTLGVAGLLGPRHGTTAASQALGGGGGWCLVTASALVVGGESGAAASHHTSTPTSAPPLLIWVGRRGGRGRGCSCPDIRPPQIEVRSSCSALQTLQGGGSRCRNKASSALFLSHTTLA